MEHILITLEVMSKLIIFTIIAIIEILAPVLTIVLGLWFIRFVKKDIEENSKK